MSTVAVVYHSGYGHTKVLAEAVARGAGSHPGTTVHLVPVEELPAPGEDRSMGGSWPLLEGADAIVMGCPTYMGSVSAGMKQFMEYSSAYWMNSAWKDKIAGGFTNSASMSGDKLNTLVDFAVFAAQQMMVWVGADLPAGNNSTQGSNDDLNRLGSYLGPMAQSDADAPPEVAPPIQDQKTGEAYGVRIAKATSRWLAGA